MTAIDPTAERNARAHQYLQEGRDDLAIPLFEEVLAERVRVLGADHPDTIASRGNLAGAYESAWCLGKAISQYKKVLAHQLRVLGAGHPDTIASRNNLASAYYAAGRLGEAIPLLKEVLADSLRVLGPDHPDTLTSRRNLEAARRARESGSASARAP